MNSSFIILMLLFMHCQNNVINCNMVSGFGAWKIHVSLSLAIWIRKGRICGEML